MDRIEKIYETYETNNGTLYNKILRHPEINSIIQKSRLFENASSKKTLQQADANHADWDLVSLSDLKQTDIDLENWDLINKDT